MRRIRSTNVGTDSKKIKISGDEFDSESQRDEGEFKWSFLMEQLGRILNLKTVEAVRMTE